MDLSRLQAQFTRYLQSLLALGYLDRGQFIPLYASFVRTSGFPSEYFSIFNSCANATLGVMEHAMAATEPDFPTVVAMVDNLLQPATRIGVLRIRIVLGYVRVYANIAHKQGCLRYLKMSRFELEALLYSLNVITEVRNQSTQLETSILQLGGAIPFDW